MTLVAYDLKTGKQVPLGSKIVDFRGDEATLVSLDRVNEMRYGGYRSGKVTASWADDKIRSVYDGVFDLEVRDAEWEADQ
ncbi:MAG: hypothetical protein AB7E75_03440 [Candidatus Methanomethylophilaceae archaeon]